MVAVTEDDANMWVKILDPEGRTIKVPALADSGSRKFSFISAECLECLPNNVVWDKRVLKTPKRIATASGEVVDITEEVGITMRLPSGKIWRDYWLILQSCPVPIIIGHDKLPTLDAMARQVRFAGKEDRRLAALSTVDSAVYIVHENDSFFEGEGEGREEDLALIPEIANHNIQEGRIDIPGVVKGSAIDIICQKRKAVFRGTLSTRAAKVTPMEINIKEGVEIPATMRERLRPVPLAYRDEVDRQLQEMLKAGVIEEVRDAEYYSQLLVVRKKDGSLRLCVDYRGLNSITIRNRHPIPLIKDLVTRLRGQQVMGVLDLSQGYWQAPLAESSRRWTTFATPAGMFRFRRVAFGLCNAPTYFQSAIQREVLGELHGSACLVYIDDIVVLGRSEEEFLKNLDAVLARLEEYGIAIKPSKCRLGVQAVEYVGLVISGEKLEMTAERKRAIADIKLPQAVTKLRSFLGLLNYFRDHIRGYADLTAPLYEVLQGNPSKRASINWTAELETIFEQCKQAAANAETLYHMEPEGEVRLYTDASERAMGGVITQLQRGIERPILFLSKKLSNTQQRYSTSDKEMLAIFHCIRSGHQLLAGRYFDVYSDHRALQSTKSSASARIERIKLALQEYDFKIHYIKGENNEIADLMSRPEEDGKPEQQRAETVVAVATNSQIDRQQIIAAHHNAFTGHFGRDHTIEAIRASGFDWPGIQGDVSKVIAECDICQRGRPMAAMRPRPFRLAAQGPNREWSADMMELEPVRGYTYILIVICNYSRFIHLTRMRSVSAAETAEALETLFLEFGRPERLRTDNGTNFKSETLNEVLAKYGVTMVEIAPYESRSNAIVERAIREIRRHIYAFTQEGQQWPDVVKQVQFIMNRAIHSATGYAPADVLFGQINSLGFGAATQMMQGLKEPERDNELDRDLAASRRQQADLQAEIERDSNVIPPSERDLAASRRQQADLQAEIVERIQAQRPPAPERRNDVGPEVGDRVWVRVRQPNKSAGREHWTGPAEIIEITGDPRDGTEILTVRMNDGGEQRLTRAKMRRIPRGVTLEGRTEGAEIIGCSSWEVGRPVDHYKLRIKHPDGSQSWEEASAWLRRPEFQVYALTAPHLSHLVFGVRDA